MTASSEQQSLVAYVFGGGIARHGSRKRGAAAIASAYDAGVPSTCAKLVGKGDRQRSLAAATDDDIADDHHRHRQALAAQHSRDVERPAQQDRGAEDQGKGRKYRSKRREALC